MKICPQCSTANAEEAMVCHKCGADLAAVPLASPSTQNSPTIRARPDGSVLLILGRMCIGIAALLLFLAFSQASRGGGGFAALNAAASMGFTLTIAGFFFQLGLALALIGQVIRAIWFLPGPTHKSVE